MLKRQIALLFMVQCLSVCKVSGSTSILDSLRRLYYQVQPAGDYYIVNQGVLCSIFNRYGTPLFPFKYHSISEAAAGNFIADRNLLIDTNGNKLAKFDGEVCSINRQNHTLKTRYANYLVAVYSEDGKVIVPLVDTTSFKKGVFSVWSNSENKTILVDTNGDKVNMGDSYIASISSKYMVTRGHDSAFVYNQKGKLLFSCRADNCKVYESGFIAVELFGLWALKDSTGKCLTDYQYCEFRDEGYKDALESCTRLVNRQGQEVFGGSSTYLSRQAGGWSEAGMEGDILDENHKVVFKKGTYEYADFIGSRFIVFDREREGKPVRTYDRKTRKFITFRPAEELGNEAYVGTINPGGKHAIFHDKVLDLPAFTHTEHLGNSGYILLKNEKRTGQFTEDIFEPGEKNEITLSTYGLLDKDMKLVLPVRYGNISLVSDKGYFLASDGKGSYLINKKGKQICTIRGYPQISPEGNITRIHFDNTTILINDTGIFYNRRGIVSFLYPLEKHENIITSPALLAIIDSTGKTGIYDLQFKQLQPHQYHVVEEKAKGLVTLKKSDSLYFMTLAGNLLFNGRGFSGRNCMLLEGGVVVMSNDAGKYGALNAAGGEQLPFVYDTAYQFWQEHDCVLGRNGSFWRMDNIGHMETCTIDGKRTNKKMVDVTAAAKARFAEGRNWYAEINDNNEGIPPGIYNSGGKFIAPVHKDFRSYPFNIGTTYEPVLMVTDSTGTMMGVIDTGGHFVLPYVPVPDLRVLNRYSLVALNRKKKSTMYRFDGANPAVIEITVDSAEKAKLIDNDPYHKFTNSATIHCSMPGIRHAIIFPRTKALLEPDIDSVIELQENVLVQKNGKWGIFRDGWQYPPECDSISCSQLFGDLWLYRGGKTGIFHNRSRVLLSPAYDKILNPQTLQNNYAVVINNNKYFLIDSKQRQLAPAYDSVEMKITPYEWRGLKGLKTHRNGITYLVSAKDNGVIEEKVLEQ